MDISDTSKWYIGAQNDAPFIINREPRPITDDPWHERPYGPTVVIAVDGLPEVAHDIVEAHNKVVDELMEEVNRLTDYAIGLTMISGDEGIAAKQALKSRGKRQELEKKLAIAVKALREVHRHGEPSKQPTAIAMDCIASNALIQMGEKLTEDSKP